MTAPSSYLRELREEQSRRRLEVARLVRDTPNVTDVELAKALNVSRNTIREDRLALMAEVNQAAKSEFQIWRGEHIAELEKLRTQLQDFLIPPEKRIELALKIIAQDAKLKGTEAATRSENINVHLDGDAIGPYRQFVLASRGLDAEQVKQLLTLAREMPRKPFVQAPRGQGAREDAIFQHPATRVFDLPRPYDARDFDQQLGCPGAACSNRGKTHHSIPGLSGFMPDGTDKGHGDQFHGLKQ